MALIKLHHQPKVMHESGCCLTWIFWNSLGKIPSQHPEQKHMQGCIHLHHHHHLPESDVGVWRVSVPERQLTEHPKVCQSYIAVLGETLLQTSASQEGWRWRWTGKEQWGGTWWSDTGRWGPTPGSSWSASIWKECLWKCPNWWYKWYYSYQTMRSSFEHTK